MKKYLLLLIFGLACQATYSQTNFPYDVVLTPVTVSGFRVYIRMLLPSITENG